MGQQRGPDSGLAQRTTGLGSLASFLRVTGYSDNRGEERKVYRLDEAGFLLDLVQQESRSATVCTEPGAIALAVARARDLVGEDPLGAEVSTSPGVMKNCLAVGLPGTERRGPEVAAALGLVAARSDRGLEALGDLEPSQVARAHTLLDEGKVRVRLEPLRSGVYVRARVWGPNHTAEVTVDGNHTRVTSATLDGQAVIVPGDTAGTPWRTETRDKQVKLETIRQLTFRQLLDVAVSADAATIDYLRRGAQSAMSLAECVLRGECPEAAPGLGQTLDRLSSQPSLQPSSQPCPRPYRDAADPFSLVARARVLVTAAVSARMGGVVWPILTSGGSGNQGILVGIPVLLVAKAVRATSSMGMPGAECRALLLAHATNLLLKAYTGEISALCGAVSAGAGVAAAVSWLLGGNQTQIEGAVQTVLGNLWGMVCDGAKASCALKCAAGAVEGMTAGYMAPHDVFLRGSEGLLGVHLEDTLHTMEGLAQRVLAGGDLALLQARRAELCRVS